MKGILTSTIIFAQAQINYTDLCCADGKKITVSKTLKKVESELFSTGLFLRINKTILINLQFIKSIQLKDSKVFMNNDMVFSISRRRLKTIQAKI